MTEADLYAEILELLEDNALYVEAERRCAAASEEKMLTAQEVMAALGIMASELDAVEVDIG